MTGNQDLHIRYLISTLDRGTRQVVNADRTVRQSVQQTNRVLTQTGQVAARAAQQHVRAATQTVQAEGRKQAATRKSSEATRRATQESAKAATQATRNTAAVGREAAAYGRLATFVSRAASMVRRSATDHARETSATNRSRVAQERLAAAYRRVTSEAGRAASRARASAQEQARSASKSGAAAAGLAGGAATRGVRGGATAAAAATGLGLAAIVRSGAQFEQVMARVRAVSGSTVRELAAMDKQAIKLGADTQFSAGQVSEGMYSLATAGFSAQDILKTMPGTVSLAAASMTDLGFAAETQAAVIRQFSLDTSKAGHVADVLTLAVNKSAIEMDDLAETLKYVGPVAGRFNQTFEDMAASSAILGNVGIKGSQAGTTLRRALVNLVRPSERTVNALEAAGISMERFTDIVNDPKTGKLNSLPQILGSLAGELKGVDAATRRRTLAQLFGVEALPGMITLFTKGEAGIRKMSKEMEHSQGIADKTASIMRKTMAGAFDQLTGSVETAAIEIVKKFSPQIQSALLDAGKGVDQFTAGLLHDRGRGSGGAAGRTARDLAGATGSFGSEAATEAKKFVNALEPAEPFLKNVMIPAAKSFGQAVATGIIATLKIATAVAKPTAAALGWLGEKLKDHPEAAKALGIALSLMVAPMTKAAAGAGIFRKALSLAFAPLRIVRTVLAPLLPLLRSLGPVLLRVVGPALLRLAPWLLRLGGPIGIAISLFFMFRKQIIGAVVAAAGGVASAAKKIGEAVIGPLRAAFKVVAAVVKVGWTIVRTQFLIAFALIYLVVKTHIKIWTTIFSTGLKVFTAVAKAIWSAVAAVFKAAASVVGAAIKVVIAVAKAYWAVIKTIWTPPLRAALAIIKAVFNTIKAGVKLAVRGLVAVAGAVWGGITAVFGGPAKAVGKVISGAFRAAWGGIKSAIGWLIDRIGGAFSGIKDIIGKIFSGGADLLGNIGRGIANWLNDHTPLGNKVKVGPVSFTLPKLQGGGFLDATQALVSPGERIVTPGGREFTVPGQPVAADSVLANIPTGSAVLTWTGQQMYDSGASLSDAVARQLPHFQKGGYLGKFTSTAYGPPWGGMQGTGVTATGVNLKGSPPKAVVAVDPNVIPLHSKLLINPNPFGKPNLVFAAEDTGGAIKGSRIDFYDWRGRSSQNHWGRRTVRVRKATAGGREISTVKGQRYVNLNALTPQEARRLLPRLTAGFGGPGASFGAGFEVGQAGLGQGLGDTDVLRNIISAARIPIANQQVNVSKAGGKDDTSAGTLTPSGSWNPRGKPIARWIVPYLKWAAAHGWTGIVSSGWRSDAEQKRIWLSGVRPAAKPRSLGGSGSNHSGTKFPSGAVDVTNASQLSSVLGRRPGRHNLVWAGSKDPVHFSHPHGGSYRRGGWIPRYRSGTPQVISTSAQPSSGPTPGAGIIGAALRLPSRANADFSRLLQGFAETVEGFAYSTIVSVRSRVLQQIKALAAGGATRRERAEIQRLRGVLSLLESEAGRRVGVLVARINAETEKMDRDRSTQSAVFRMMGISDTSNQAVRAVIRLTQAQQDIMVKQRDALEKARDRALRMGDKATAQTLRNQMNGLSSAIIESMASLAELQRQLLENMAQSITAVAEATNQTVQRNQTAFEQGLRMAGVDQSSSVGQKAVAEFLRQQNVTLGDAVWRMTNDLNRLISQGGSADQIQSVRDAIQGLNDQITENAVQMAEAARQAVLAAAQEAVDAGQHGINMADIGFQQLELQQKLSGTYDSAQSRQARADYITQNTIPSMQAELSALQAQKAAIEQQTPNDVASLRSVIEAIGQQQTAIMQAQLDAQEATADNTEELLKKFSGSATFDFNGQQYTDNFSDIATGL